MCHCTIACVLIAVKLIQRRKIGTDITGNRSRRRFVSDHSLCDVTCDSSPFSYYWHTVQYLLLPMKRSKVSCHAVASHG